MFVMKKTTVCMLLLLLFISAPSSAQNLSPAVRNCFALFLPDLTGPEPTAQPHVAYYFPVAPTVTNLFYPFDIQVNVNTAGLLDVVVTQNIYNDTAKQSRVFTNLVRASLVTWSSDIEDSYTALASVNGETRVVEKAKSTNAGYVPVRDYMQILGYHILPSPLTPANIENTWGIRFDARVRKINDNRAMSKPLNPGDRWNVGIYAPYGIAHMGLQVELQLCRN